MAISLVTGGAGFIGAHVAKKCLRRGDHCVILDDLSGGFEENIPEGCTFIRGSIADASLVNKLFASFKFDYVYHMAAYAAEGLSHFIRRFNYTNNIIGTVTLVNAAVNSKNVKRFVFTSSIAVYGSAQVPMLEATTPVPEDPYGIAKYASELDIKAAAHMFDLPYTIFRPHNVYGEGQNIGDRYRNVVGIFINRAMQGMALPVFGDGLQTRAFTYVDDIIPQIVDCVSNDRAVNRTFNIGSEQPYTVLDVARAVSLAFGGDLPVEHLHHRNEVVHAFSSNELCASVFGASHSTPLNEGVRKMALWAISNGVKSTRSFNGIEIMSRLPQGWEAE